MNQFDSPNLRHLRNSTTWNSWRGMRSRCTNKKDTRYKSYGGSGVKICKKWFRFAGFLEDMGIRPAGTTLDRINPSGDYTPENCRWADSRTQRLNRVHPTGIMAFGEIKAPVEWSLDSRCVTSFKNLVCRLGRKWPAEKAILEPTRTW